MRRLIIVGCGNFGQVVHHYFANDSDYDVVAFAVDAEFMGDASSFHGLPVVPFEELRERHPPDDHDVFVALGLRDLNRMRAAKLAAVEEMGYVPATYVASRAIVPPDLEVGPNSWIMEGAQVHPYVRFGRNTIIWSRSTIGFNSDIGDHCWVSGGLVGESVTVGEGTFIGLGATVASFLTVGVHNVIGAGAVILEDTDDYQVYRGAKSEPSRVPSTRFSRFNG